MSLVGLLLYFLFVGKAPLPINWFSLLGILLVGIFAYLIPGSSRNLTLVKLIFLDGIVLSSLIFFNYEFNSLLYLLYLLTIFGSSLYFGVREIIITTFAVIGFYLSTIGLQHYLYGAQVNWPTISTHLGLFIVVTGFLCFLDLEKNAQKELVAKLTKKNREFQSLTEVAKSISSTLELDKVLELLANKVLETFTATACLITLVDSDSNTLQMRMAKGFNNPTGFQRFRSGQGLSGKVAQTGEPKYVYDLKTIVDPDMEPQVLQVIEENHLASALAVPIKFKKRVIGVLAIYNSQLYLYNSEDTNLLNALASQAASAIQNAKMFTNIDGLLRLARQERNVLEQELELAAQVQQALLPSSPVLLEHMSTYMGLVPAHKVGGDFFDYFPLGDQKWGVIIGDVMGHGLQAAMMMTQTRAVIKALALQGGSPGQVLAQANKILYPDFHRLEMFTTLIYRIYDAKTRTICYSNAAHCPTVFYRRTNGTFLKLQKGGFALGMFPDAAYEEEFIELLSGDVGIGYSDGLLDAENREGQKFGVKGLEGLLIELADLEVKRIYEEALKRVKDFSNGELKDDLTLLVTKVN